MERGDDLLRRLKTHLELETLCPLLGEVVFRLRQVGYCRRPGFAGGFFPGCRSASFPRGEFEGNVLEGHVHVAEEELISKSRMDLPTDGVAWSRNS